MTYKIQYIYIYESGEVEGFIGEGETMGKVYNDVINKIKSKVQIKGEIFDRNRIKKDLRGLSYEQRKKVELDFKIKGNYESGNDR